METTHTLSLPYIIAAQAQKHVTHNEALRMLDALTQIAVASRIVASPPTTPAGGECWLVPDTGAAGEFAGHGGELAVFQDGAFTFLTPKLGWSVYVADEGVQIVLGLNGWQDLVSGSGSGNGGGGVTGQLGLNAAASTTTRLAVGSDNSLFTHDVDGSHRMAINREDTASTASMIWQTGFQADAELGLTGLDDMALKVRSSGGDWANALTVDRETGLATIVAAPHTDNMLINSDMRINQRSFGGGALAGGTFGYDRWKGDASGGTILRNGAGRVELASGSVVQPVETFPAGFDSLVFGVAGLTGGVLRVTVEGTTTDIQPDQPFGFSTFSVTPGVSGSVELSAPSGAVLFDRVSLVAGGQSRMACDRHPDIEFALCVRYFCTSLGEGQVLQDYSGSIGYHMGICYAGGNIASQRISFPRRMRVPPTVSYYAPNSGNPIQSGKWQLLGPQAGYANANSMGVAELTQTAFVLNVVFPSASSGDAYLMCGNWSASAEL
ncbi:DUF2793 domain-containing protein [Ahrensia sp. R2A130]|uniref:DUF2793 domain-containing protein n=1 Tax=Ahrensia sp. R2A130 TaxID=744979 RepID=UPI0001E08C2E|nr:DUF2793 domain-containing protein [Ahrensia sp. R2A130]EFL89532.1 rb133 [Ahrensia sp. R2A130]